LRARQLVETRATDDATSATAPAIWAAISDRLAAAGGRRRRRCLRGRAGAAARAV